MKYRILIIDDDKDIMEVYSRALERNGFETVCVKDGADGMDALKMSEFDLIILDLVMPKMDGTEFLRILRDDPRLKDMKVLVSSSRVYEYKPKHPRGLVERIIDNLTGAPVKEEPMQRVQRTRISQKAEEAGTANVSPDKITIEEKSGKQEMWSPFSFSAMESDIKHRRRIGVELVNKVRQILGINHVEGVIDEKPEAE